MRPITLLRISYLTGALLDFLIAAAALIPANMGVAQFVYPMGAFSATACSWGVLLLFALRKPFERNWVLLPTILVVVLGLIAGSYSTIEGILPFNIFLPKIIAGVFCIVLWAVSYIKSFSSVEPAV